MRWDGRGCYRIGGMDRERFLWWLAAALISVVVALTLYWVTDAIADRQTEEFRERERRAVERIQRRGERAREIMRKVSGGTDG